MDGHACAIAAAEEQLAAAAAQGAACVSGEFTAAGPLNLPPRACPSCSLMAIRGPSQLGHTGKTLERSTSECSQSGTAPCSKRRA